MDDQRRRRRLAVRDFDVRRPFAARRAGRFRARAVARFLAVARLFVVFARAAFLRRDLAAVLAGRRFGAGFVSRLSTFCAPGAIGSPAADRFPAIAPTAPPTAAPMGPATLPIRAPAAAPATGLEMGGTSMFSDCCSCDSSAIKCGAPFVLLIVQ